MTRAALGLLVALAACSSEAGSDVTLRRSDKDAPAVVEVEGSAQIDLAAAREVEPNNTADKATPLELPVAVAGVLESPKDIDMFTLVPPRSGALVVSVDEVDGIDVIVELADAAGKVLVTADRGPARTTEGIPNYPVAKGEPVVVVIKELERKSRRGKKAKSKKGAEGDEPARPPYRVEVRMLEGAPDDLEREPNSEVAAARTVLLGDRPSGYLGWNKDVDLWKLSLQGFGANNLVDLSIEGIDGVTLELELSDAEGKTVLERSGARSGALYVRGLKVPETPFLIARLSGKRSHESQRYRLHFATRHRDEGAEVEPNDSGKQATELTGEASGTATGHISGEDVDFFTIEPVDEPVTLTVEVEGPAGIKMSLEAWAGGKSLGTETGVGKAELFGLSLAAGQRVRFKVSASGVSGDPAAYVVTWMHAKPDAVDPGDQPVDDPDDQPIDPTTDFE
jgi:hypothetical protein